jgi:two-component sensor histidine kinase
VLLQEIHHRVKNNLQIIVSLINMQMRKLAEPQSRQVLNECKTRVDAIALIHEKLYQSTDFSSVPFASYSRGLVTTISQATGLSFERVAVELSIDELALPVAQAIPCGLIINELVTNAIKHAFPGHRTGTIRVALARLDANTLRLEVTDDGIGMAEFIPTAERESIGLHLVVSLADQLNGKLQVATERGVAVTLEFPCRVLDGEPLIPSAA